MDNRYLGKTGLAVSDLCLGTMTFERETSEQDSFTLWIVLLMRVATFWINQLCIQWALLKRLLELTSRKKRDRKYIK